MQVLNLKLWRLESADLVGLEAGAPISDAQLLSLAGKEDQEVEAFWVKCSSRQQQQLWKKFEKKRMEGSEFGIQRSNAQGKEKRPIPALSFG